MPTAAPPKPPDNKSDNRFDDENLNPAAQEILDLEKLYNSPAYGEGDGGDGDGGDRDSSGDNDDRNSGDGSSSVDSYPSEEDLTTASERRKQREAEREKRRDAERQEFEAAGNQTNLNIDKGFNYTPDPNQKPSLRKRRNVIAFGSAGGIIGLVMAVFGFLTPFKIPSLMQAAADEAGQRVEQVTVHRAKVILARAILSKFGALDGTVYTGKGPVSTLIATWRTNKFEERLAAKGLKIEKIDGGIRITLNNEVVGNGVLKNEEDILKAFEEKPGPNKWINILVREDMPSWRLLKRAKFALWLRIKYGISKYGVKNSEKSDPDERVQEMQGDRLEEQYNRMADNVGDGIDCIMGEDSCEAKDGNKDIKNSDAKQISEDIRKTGKEIADQARQTKRALMGRLTGLMQRTLIGKIGTKLIPIVGWIDFVATADHIAWNALNDDYFSQVPALFKGRSYAQAYGDWQGYSDQTKAGMLDPYFMGLLADQLIGAEVSRAYNYINGEPEKGQGVNDDQKVNSNNLSLIAATWRKFKDIPGTPVNTSSHVVLNIYYETIGGGGILGWLSGGISNIISAAVGFVTPDAVEEWMGKAVLKMFDVMGDLMGWNLVDPLDKGVKLYNGIHAGATVAYNEYCKIIGCRLLTTAQANAQNESIAVERAQNLADKGWMYAAFSPDVTTSVTSKLAVALPASPLTNEGFDADTAVTGLANLVTNMPSNAFSALMPKTHATTRYVDLYGVAPYGALPGDLESPVAPQAITGEECPKVAEKTYDGCTIDKTVAQALLCNETPELPDCNFVQNGGSTDQPDDDTPQTPSAAGMVWPIALDKWPASSQPIAECGLQYSNGTVHTGIDISVPMNTPVRAAAAGVISMSNATYGALNIQTSLKDENGKTLFLNYQHLLRRDFKVGDTVEANQVIGVSGKTGTASPHLHFGVWTTNSFLGGWDPINSTAGRATLAQMKHPMNYLPEDGRKIAECGDPPYKVP